MNENLNLVEILKDCPKGTKLYSSIFGDVFFQEIKDTGRALLIIVLTSCNTRYEFYTDGRFNKYYEDSECVLFPSKDNRDWSTFVAPKKKVERFDPKTLKPFEKVLVRSDGSIWKPRFFSFFGNLRNDRGIIDTGGCWWEHAIPYEGNEELLFTTNEPDEYYKYWEK